MHGVQIYFYITLHYYYFLRFPLCHSCIRGTKVLENRNIADDERIQQMEKELEMTVMFGEEADRKFELVRRCGLLIDIK
jgi:hypothetical protein